MVRMTKGKNLRNLRGKITNTIPPAARSGFPLADTSIPSNLGVREQTLKEAYFTSDLRLLTNLAPILMAHIDKNGHHLSANALYCDWFGLNPKKIAGIQLKDVLGDAIFNKTQKHLDTCLEGNEASFEMEMPCKQKGLRKVWVEYTPQFDAEGNVSGLFTLLRDITERKFSPKNAWLAAIVDSSLDAIISKDFNGIVISWNSGAEKMFGYAAHEMIGKPINIVYPDGEMETMQKIAADIKAGKVVPPLESRRIRKDGVIIDIMLTMSAIRNEEGEPIAVSAISRDISDRKKLENELMRLNETLEHRVQERTYELEAYMNRLRRLTLELAETEQKERKRLAKILHDNLQQLLVAAKMRAERLAGKLQDLGENKLAREVIELLILATESTHDLAVDIQPPVLEKLDLRASLRWLAEWMHDKHGLHVAIHMSKDIRFHEISPGLISFLFEMARELFFNVVKHSGIKKASIDVFIDDNNCLRASVSDNGAGQAVSPLTDGINEPGGIGLFSMQERLIALGGGLRIETAQDMGFKVHFWLPVTKKGEITYGECAANPLNS